MRGKLNLRLLLATLVAAAVFAPSWFFLHRFQKNRRLSDYLVQTTRAEEEQKPERAARFLRAYVLAVPTDTDARLRYAGLIEKLGQSTRDKSAALDTYEQALRQDPDRPAARRRAAELAAELGRVDAALAHLEALPEPLKSSGPLLLLKGQCLEGKGQYKEAAETYARSCRAEPKPEPFLRRAGVLKVRLKQSDETKPDGTEVGPQAVLNEFVKALPNSFESYLARAMYRATYDKATGLARARADLEVARKLAPDELGVLLVSAQVASDQAAKEVQDTDPVRAARERYREEARGYLRHALAKHPKEPAPYLALADLETRAGRREEAVKALTSGRKEVPPARLPEVLFALAEQFAEAGNADGTAEVVGQLQKLNQDPVRINFVRGLLQVRQGQWYEGSGTLERVRPLVATGPETAARVDLLLAQCYGNLGDIDRQLTTYRRAVSAAPLDWRPRLGLAGALAALGRGEEAIDEYRHITQMERSPAGAWVALARLMVFRNLARPPAERQWDEASRLLAEAAKAVTDSVEVPLLEAEILFAKGDLDGARKLLTACRDGRPKEPEFWYALAALTDRAGDGTRGATFVAAGGGRLALVTDRAGDNRAANAVLDEAVRQLGDTAELRIARLRVTEYTSVEQSLAVLAGLAAGVERFPPDERLRLLRALAAAYWFLDRPAEARGLWAQVAALRPTELNARLLQFDAALKLNDDAGMQQVLAEIRRIEGNGPLEKYGLATRLIWVASRGDRSGLSEARALLAAAAARRPGWPRVPLGLARIDELEGNTEGVVKHLKEAVDLGERQLSVVKQLAQLLDEAGREKEADDILRRLEAQSPLSNDLQRMAAELSLRLDTDRALDLARKAINKDSRDYRERVWLGRILSAGGRPAEAEREFESAVSLAGDKSPVWVAYVQHAARGRGADPATVLGLVKRAEAALGDKELLALALCYELAGKSDEAEKRYLGAIAADRTDARAVRAAATFYQQTGSPEKAEPLLRKLLSPELKAPDGEAAWARRNLALGLGVRDDGPGYEEAIRLLDLNAAGGEQVDDLRTRAVITATRPGRRQEVIALLERAEKLKPPAPEHSFLLAQLYEAEGQWPKARDRMVRLSGSQKDNTRYLAAFTRSLIRRGDPAEAAVWMGRLAEKAPNQQATVTLQVQLWCRTGKAESCVPLLREYAQAKDGSPADPAERALAAADLFDQAHWAGAGREAADEAERLYARFQTLSKRPDAALPLAGFYGRQDAPGKALALCERALKTVPLEQVLVAALGATSGASADAAHFATVEGWFNQALAKKPDSAGLRFLLGALREQQGKYAAAEAEYRKVLDAVPTHAAALNNLTFLLAMGGKGGAALDMAGRAFRAAPTPPPADLLDTRAVAYLAAGDLAAAKTDLEAATAQDAPATALFHLAVVYDKLKEKDRTKAVTALRRAQSAGLRPGLLHPLERDSYRKLVADLRP